MTTRVMKVGQLTADIVAQRPRVNIRTGIVREDSIDVREIDDTLTAVQHSAHDGVTLMFANCPSVSGLARNSSISVTTSSVKDDAESTGDDQ